MAPALGLTVEKEGHQLNSKLNIRETVGWFSHQEPDHPSSHTSSVAQKPCDFSQLIDGPQPTSFSLLEK